MKQSNFIPSCEMNNSTYGMNNSYGNKIDGDLHSILSFYGRKLLHKSKPEFKFIVILFLYPRINCLIV